MPKKHHNRVLFTKPASSVPQSLSSRNSTATPASGSQSATPTVNELLRDARRADGVTRPTDVAATSSLPPLLRAVFDLPPPPPPTILRRRLNGVHRNRRIPGPPPPQSWLNTGDSDSSQRKLSFHLLRWIRARVAQEPIPLPGAVLPSPGSLQHLILKAMASHWAWHVEYDNGYLADLPVGTRMLLLTYLASYDDAHWPNPLPILFPPDALKEDLNAVTRLDLSSWLGTTKRLERELVIAAPTSLSSQDELFVPESWEQEIPQTVYVDRARFHNLKHVSLAVNVLETSTLPSWTALVSMTSHLSRLESLSLANWPQPTYTPNAAKGRFKIVDGTGVAGPQVYGGTNMYSATDDDWREAAGILKSLSRNLYCLQWLDLSGCASWLPALTWSDEAGECGPDWNGSWRNVKTLILRVGWLPGRPLSREELEMSSASLSSSSIDSRRAIEQLYGSSEAIQQALEHLAELRLGGQPAVTDTEELPWNVEHEREKEYLRRDLETWRSEAQIARRVLTRIRACRRAAGGRYIDIIADDASAQSLEV